MPGKKVLVLFAVVLLSLSMSVFSRPDFAETTYKQAHYYYDIGRYDLSIREIKNIVATGDAKTIPDMFQKSLYLLAMNYLKLDQYQIGNAYLQRLIFNPYSAILMDESQLNRILSVILDENYLEAFSLIHDYLVKNPPKKFSGEAKMLQAETYIILGKKEEAKSLLLDIIRNHVTSECYFDALVRYRQMYALGEAKRVPQIEIEYQLRDRIVNHNVASEFKAISEEEYAELLAWKKQLDDRQKELDEREKKLTQIEEMLNKRDKLIEYKKELLQSIDEKIQEKLEFIQKEYEALNN